MCLRIKTFLNFKNPFSFVLKVNLFYKTLHRVHLNHTVSLNLSLRYVYQTRWTWWNIYHNLHKYSVHTLRNTAVCNKILQSYILHALFNSDILMMIYFENKWEGTLHNAQLLLSKRECIVHVKWCTFCLKNWIILRIKLHFAEYARVRYYKQMLKNVKIKTPQLNK